METINESAGTKRVELYDRLRVIATIYIIIGHSTYLNVQATYGAVDYRLPAELAPAYSGTLLSFFRFLSDWVGAFPVPLFFFLSGAVMGLRPVESLDKFVKSKIKRLIIPYYFAGIFFMFPIKTLGNFYNPETVRLAITTFWSGGGTDCGHLWFLIALFWCMVAFTILVKILQRARVNSIFLILLICYIVTLIYDYIPFDFLKMKAGLSYMFWFGAGYAFEEYRKSHNFVYGRSALICILLILFYAFNSRYNLLDGFFSKVLGIFFTIELCITLSPLFKLINKKANKQYTGFIKRLFDIYIFHDPLHYIILRIFFENNLLTTNFGCYSYLFIRVIGVISVSILIGSIIDVLKRKVKSKVKYDTHSCV
ncbi:MAG: acyltransferase [Ruminococcaceae bacterium]|nr:acyltransferase [Oscillospiraceae bacterium]